MLNGVLPATLGLAIPSEWMNNEFFLEVIKDTASPKENQNLLIFNNRES